ncbi:hypothetical protein ACFXTI_019127 [Malus domestica]
MMGIRRETKESKGERAAFGSWKDQAWKKQHVGGWKKEGDSNWQSRGNGGVHTAEQKNKWGEERKTEKRGRIAALQLKEKGFWEREKGAALWAARRDAGRGPRGECCHWAV